MLLSKRNGAYPNFGKSKFETADVGLAELLPTPGPLTSFEGNMGP